jgi:NADPH:quinone reductase-like Zn-dependent oxidoreductase
VFGDISGCGWGGFAEYVCARESAFALKPARLNFEEAAAVPQAAVLALQGLRYKGKVQPGQKVLINGAGGGAGTFAVQIAKSFGAEVTGVDKTEKLDTLRSIGADHVIDFTREDFTQNEERYDLIVDVAVYRSIFDCKRALSPNGTYAVIGGSTARIMFEVMLLGSLISITGEKKLGLLIHKPNADDLAFLNKLLETGKVVPVIDRSYMLSEVPEALRYFGEGNVQGKVVITV